MAVQRADTHATGRGMALSREAQSAVCFQTALSRLARLLRHCLTSHTLQSPACLAPHGDGGLQRRANSGHTRQAALVRSLDTANSGTHARPVTAGSAPHIQPAPLRSAPHSVARTSTCTARLTAATTATSTHSSSGTSNIPHPLTQTDELTTAPPHLTSCTPPACQLRADHFRPPAHAPTACLSSSSAIQHDCHSTDERVRWAV